MNPRPFSTFRILPSAFLLALLATAPSTYAGWQLVWNDEFDGTGVDTNKWAFETGNGTDGWGNGEREYYTGRPQNAYLADATDSNNLLTTGEFAATPIGPSVLVPSTPSTTCYFGIPRLGDYLY